MAEILAKVTTGAFFLLKPTVVDLSLDLPSSDLRCSLVLWCTLSHHCTVYKQLTTPSSTASTLRRFLLLLSQRHTYTRRYYMIWLPKCRRSVKGRRSVGGVFICLDLEPVDGQTTEVCNAWLRLLSRPQTAVTSISDRYQIAKLLLGRDRGTRCEQLAQNCVRSFDLLIDLLLLHAVVLGYNLIRPTSINCQQ